MIGISCSNVQSDSLILKVFLQYLQNKMRNLSILLILILAKAIYLLEIDKMKTMSFASDFQINSTIVRHKRYLDFIPKSRMFVSNN